LVFQTGQGTDYLGSSLPQLRLLLLQQRLHGLNHFALKTLAQCHQSAYQAISMGGEVTL